MHYFFRELFCNSPTNKTIFSALQLAGGIVAGADGVGDVRCLTGGIADGIDRNVGCFQRSCIKNVGTCAHGQHDGAGLAGEGMGAGSGSGGMNTTPASSPARSGGGSSGGSSGDDLESNDLP